MRILTIIISILLIIQIFSLESYAQEKTNERIEYKNSLTFNIAGLFTRKTIFGYERNLNNRNFILITIGRKFPSSAESYKSKSFGLFTTKNYNKVSTGISFSLGYKYIISTYARLYLSAEVHYYHEYYDKKYYQFCVGTSRDSYVSLESMWSKEKGLKIIFGKKLRILSGNKVGLEFDFFIASGIAFRNQEFTVHKKRQGTCSINTEFFEYDPPQTKLTEKWEPTMNIGILIAMPFSLR